LPGSIAVVPLATNERGEPVQVSFLQVFGIGSLGRSFKVAPGWSHRISIYKDGNTLSELVVIDERGEAFWLRLDQSSRDQSFAEVVPAKLAPLDKKSESFKIANQTNYKIQVFGMFALLPILALLKLLVDRAFKKTNR
jgi:hypothetical protein